MSHRIFRFNLFLFAIISVVFCLGCSRPQGASGEPSFFVPVDPPEARYVIEAACRLEEEKVVVEGKEGITFQNPSGNPLSVVAFEWADSPEFSLEVRAGDAEALTLQESEDSVYYFHLPEPLAGKASMTLNVRYTMAINAREDGRISLQFWHPRLWWGGLPTKSSFRVKMDIPDGYKMASSGRLNPETGYLENDCVTSRFGFWLAKDVSVEEREADGILIRALSTEEGRECALLCLETAVDVIRFYKQILGVYPHKSLTIIPGGSGPWGGYPFASALVVIHGQEVFEKAPGLHWKWITAHEVGHQYWGEYVMSADERAHYTESWLMIGMGIFTDRMWVEARGLPDDKHLSFFNRFLSGLKEHYDITADAPQSLKAQQAYDRNNILIHGKGYSIVSALRSALGDEVFKSAFRRSIREYAGRRLGWRDFQRIAEEESGENLRWFFDQWVRSPRYLCYRITSSESRQQGGEYLTKIVVERLGESIAMPVEVLAAFEDGSEQTARTNRLLRINTLIFHSGAALKEAVLDPNRLLAMLAEPLPVLPAELPAKMRALGYSDDFVRGLELYKLALEADVKDRSIWFKLGMVIFEGGYLDESFTCFDKMLELEPEGRYAFFAKTWMGNIRDAQGRREEAVGFYNEALRLFAGDSTSHDQFGIESSDTWIRARLKGPYDWSKVIKQ
jgi:tetratricopeptide (TPR) repeat protein